MLFMIDGGTSGSGIAPGTPSGASEMSAWMARPAVRSAWRSFPPAIGPSSSPVVFPPPPWLDAKATKASREGYLWAGGGKVMKSE